ncbi:Sof1 family domain-containing protein, partial [Toxoplasma gondii ARI]
MDTEGRGERIGHRACYHASCLSPRLSPCCTSASILVRCFCFARFSPLPFRSLFSCFRSSTTPTLSFPLKRSPSLCISVDGFSLLLSPRCRAASLRRCISSFPFGFSPLGLWFFFSILWHTSAVAKMVKVKVIHRNPADYVQQKPGQLQRVVRNFDPQMHPFEREREYTRALNAVKLQKMFAKPLLFCMEGHRDGVKTMVRAKSQA